VARASSAARRHIACARDGVFLPQSAAAVAAEPASITTVEVVLRLLAATGAAAVIGWERETQRRPAGLRTHVLVGLGSCLFTLLAIDAAATFAAPAPGGSDPLRVVDGIVGGVGFLGAGAIMQSHGAVKGLTTAAGIWVVAAFGVAAAFGSYRMLAIALVLAGLTLTALARFERAWLRSHPDRGSVDADEGADEDDAEGAPARTPTARATERPS
jgi:putative Mg2+ transporter-C (MgtC) family protein